MAGTVVNLTEQYAALMKLTQVSGRVGLIFLGCPYDTKPLRSENTASVKHPDSIAFVKKLRLAERLADTLNLQSANDREWTFLRKLWVTLIPAAAGHRKEEE